MMELWEFAFSASLANSRSHANLVNHIFCKTKQEILLRHMGIINIHGYCHARVHAGIIPLCLIHPSSSLHFGFSSHCSC